MQVKYDRKLLIALGRSRKASQWQNKEMLWSGFLDKLATTTRTRETVAEYAAMPKGERDTIKDVGGFVGGYLKNGKRNNASVVNRCMLCLDADNAEPGLMDDLDMTFINAYALYSTKTAKVNEGEAPQFFVENSHPGIISREVFDLVQLEMKRRKGRSRHTSAKSLFSDRLVCSCCGGTFGSKVWHSNDPYRKVIWRCNRKYARKGNACPNRHLEEKELREAFVEAVNRLISRREEILDAAEDFSSMLADTSGLEQQLDRLTAEKDVLLRKLTAMVHENAVKEQDQEEYQRQYQEVEGELSRLDAEMEKMKTKKADRLLRRNKLQAFMGRLRASDQLAAFDEGMFLGLTETVRVCPDKLAFVFRDGTEIPVYGEMMH